jgi:hypothetical protein
MANQLFNQLKNGLRKADGPRPEKSTVAIGFTKFQMLKMDLKKPRLVFYDAQTDTFYDQGDSTKIKKTEWCKINQSNFKKNVPMKNLQYYCILNESVVAESNKYDK